MHSTREELGRAERNYRGTMSKVSHPYDKNLRRILCFERSRSQRQGSEFSREVEFMMWFPVAFLTNGVFTVTHGGIELATPVL